MDEHEKPLVAERQFFFPIQDITVSMYKDNRSSYVNDFSKELKYFSKDTKLKFLEYCELLSSEEKSKLYKKMNKL